MSACLFVILIWSSCIDDGGNGVKERTYLAEKKVSVTFYFLIFVAGVLHEYLRDDLTCFEAVSDI